MSRSDILFGIGAGIALLATLVATSGPPPARAPTSPPPATGPVLDVWATGDLYGRAGSELHTAIVAGGGCILRGCRGQHDSEIVIDVQPADRGIPIWADEERASGRPGDERE